MKFRSNISVLLWAIGLLLPVGVFAQPCSSPPSVQASADTSICSSRNRALLNATYSNAGGIEWITGNGRFFPDNETANAAYVPSFAETQAGFVDLVIQTTSHNPCPTDYDTVHVTIIAAPEEEVIGPLAICEYSSGIDYSVPTLPGGSYEWHVVGGGIDSGSGTNEISVTWASEGPGYIYCVMQDSNGCEGVGSISPISRFNFSTNEVGKATVGPDAVSYDSDAYSDGEGFGIDGNCNGSKGLDLEIAGSTFDRGKIAMTFSWQRDESNADFFERGDLKFWINGGHLRIEFEQVDPQGGTNKVGPINTQYTVPNDDLYRHFTFAYDSASGIARVLVNDSIVWEYNSGNRYSINWNGAGNAMIGQRMDGSCQGNPLLDWLNISIPISIVPGPLAGTTFVGDTSICQFGTGTYTADSNAGYQFDWEVIGGNVTSGLNTKAITAYFASPYAEVNLAVLDPATGCDTSIQVIPTIKSISNYQIQGTDTLCFGDSVYYWSASASGRTYNWSLSAGTSLSSQTMDSFYVHWNLTGTDSIFLNVSDTALGCSADDTLLVSKAAYPSPQIIGPDSTCINGTEIFTATNTIFNLNWSVNNGILNSASSDTEANITAPGSGMLQIYLEETNTSYGCATQVVKSVGLYQKPITSDIKY